jgi:hypothetical protein
MREQVIQVVEQYIDAVRHNDVRAHSRGERTALHPPASLSAVRAFKEPS